MKYFAPLLVLSLISASHANPLITHGVPAQQGVYPFFVAIGLAKKPIDRQFSACGGALIAPHWVLTAKHCMINYYPDLGYGAKVAVGSVDLSIPTSYQTAKVSKVFYYDDSSNLYGSDIALVKLDHDLSLPTIELANYQVVPMDFATVVGQGIDETSKASPVVRVATIPIDNDQYCEQQTDLHYVLGREICAGTTSGLRINAALGDSGGPLLQQRKGHTYLIGIVSRGQYDWEKPLPSIYTNVSTYYQWIMMTMYYNTTPR